MTYDEFKTLMRKMGMNQRRKTVAALLAGNDTGCFTVQQYAEAYHRICHRDDPYHKDDVIRCLTTVAPQHLRSVGMKEVKPDVWASVSLEEAL